MNVEKYQRKYNEITEKCFIEAGIEILVYNVLEEVIESKGLTLVNISTMKKKGDTRLQTLGGVPDFAITSQDFKYKNEEKGMVFGFIETKVSNMKKENAQLIGHIASGKTIIFTNGLIWSFYKLDDCSELAQMILKEEEKYPKERKLRDEAIIKGFEQFRMASEKRYNPINEINLTYGFEGENAIISREKFNELMSYLWKDLNLNEG